MCVEAPQAARAHRAPRRAAAATASRVGLAGGVRWVTPLGGGSGRGGIGQGREEEGDHLCGGVKVRVWVIGVGVGVGVGAYPKPLP